MNSYGIAIRDNAPPRPMGLEAIQRGLAERLSKPLAEWIGSGHHPDDVVDDIEAVLRVIGTPDAYRIVRGLEDAGYKPDAGLVRAIDQEAVSGWLAEVDKVQRDWARDNEAKLTLKVGDKADFVIQLPEGARYLTGSIIEVKHDTAQYVVTVEGYTSPDRGFTVDAEGATDPALHPANSKVA